MIAIKQWNIEKKNMNTQGNIRQLKAVAGNHIVYLDQK